MSWLVRYAGIAYLASFAVPVATWLARTALVPRSVAHFGAASYLLVIGYDALCIAAPQYVDAAAIQILGTGPVCLSTLIIGVSLTAKNARATPAAQEATR